jgi:hypothetical protein
MAKDELKKTHETWKEKTISCYVAQTGVYIYL